MGYNTGYFRPYHHGGDCDSGPIRMAPADKIAKAGTGNAAKDGYTVVARRLQGDLPGDIIPAADADRIESDYNNGPLNDY